MLIYAGIDEAGYGPLLGPLCVGCSVFIVDGHDPAAGAPNLWRLLNRAVCRLRKDSRGRIAIEDSKKLKGANSSVTIHPLKHLERGVLSCLLQVPSAEYPPVLSPGPCVPDSELGARNSDLLPAFDDELFAQLTVALPEAPWCCGASELPVAHGVAELRIAASRLQRAMSAAGVSCAMMRCEAIDAAEFNRQVARTNNKAAVNLGAALRLVDAVWRRWPGEHPRIILDRHGGRTRYREELQLAWPGVSIRILAEDEKLCRYRLERDGSLLTVTFMPDAEEAHLPVALASMTAKYVRELFMLRLNRFFASHVPELKPTAGYYSDARRYLEAIEPAIRRLSIPLEQLVRAV